MAVVVPGKACAMRLYTSGVLAAAVAVGLALRLGFGLTLEGLGAASDEALWDGLAEAFGRLGILHPDPGTYRPPLYPLMLSGVYQVAGRSPAAARVWQAVLGGATCVLVYGVGRRLGNRSTGALASWLVALYPLFIYFTGVLLAETLLVFLVAGALLLALWHADNSSPGRSAALGVVLGLGALCKPVVLAWVPPLLWGLDWKPGRRLSGLVVLGALALTVAPWTLRNLAVTGRVVPISSNLGMNLLIGMEPDADGVYHNERDYVAMHRSLTKAEDPVVQDRHAALRAVGWMADSPLRTLWLSVRKIALLWSPYLPGESAFRSIVSVLSCGPVLCLGLWGLVQLRGRPEAWAIGSLVVSLSLVHALFFAHARFRLPIDVALMGPAAWTLAAGWGRWVRGTPTPPRGGDA